MEKEEKIADEVKKTRTRKKKTNEEIGDKKEEKKTTKKPSTRKKKAEDKVVESTSEISNIEKEVEPNVEEALAEVKEEIKEEINETSDEQEKIEENKEAVEDTSNENVNVVEENNDTKTTKNKVSITTVILALICATLAIILIVSKVSSTTIKLDNYECFAGKNITMKLPNKYLFSTDGIIFENNNNILTTKGSFYAAASNDEDYQYLADMITSQYGGEQSTRGDYKTTTLSQETEQGTFMLYYLYRNDIIVEFQFVDTDENVALNIIDSLHF